MAISFDRNKAIKMLISQAKTLKESVGKVLYDSTTEPASRYVGFKMYAESYNNLARETEKVLGLPKNSFPLYRTDLMKSYMDTLGGTMKQVVEGVYLETGMLLTYLESATDFVEDEFENISNFFKSKLRASIFTVPEKEVEVQNALELLLIGRGLNKGIDYDRETGKFEYSGKEYIPDFILPKLKLCIEVKLLKDGKRSRIIDEINADITAYSTKYERLLFVVYDLGFIRDENEFRRDIENAGENIKVLIIKH